tara:strand:- start:234 stop:842 length:609 start_codon:yes stop_codon:yes gene_type:complete
MKRKNFIFALFILIFTFLTIKGFAYSTDPKEFIAEIVVDAKKILIKSNSKELRTKKLSEIALKTVDIKGIGSYTLGRYRKEFDTNELEKYYVLFEKYFLKSFTSRLSDYSDPKIEVISSEILNPKYTIVKSILLATDDKPEIKIDWRVYTKNPEKPLIRDLMIEGISLAKTQKEEFASIIESNNGDIKILFQKLKEFIDKND